MAVIPIGSGTGLFGFGGKFGANTISDASGAVSDLFAAEGHRFKAKGDLLEKQNYEIAAGLARQNEEFTKTSAAIQQSQLDRENFKMLGGQQADIASAGFANSGSAIDLMRESASQGALTKAVAGEQGLITEAGFEEQAKSYDTMAQAAQVAADAENKAATGADITGVIKGVAAVATVL